MAHATWTHRGAARDILVYRVECACGATMHAYARSERERYTAARNAWLALRSAGRAQGCEDCVRYADRWLAGADWEAPGAVVVR